MQLPALLLFILSLLLSVFCSSSETAIVGANPYRSEYSEKEEFRKPRLIRRLSERADSLSLAILAGHSQMNMVAGFLCDESGQVPQEEGELQYREHRSVADRLIKPPFETPRSQPAQFEK